MKNTLLTKADRIAIAVISEPTIEKAAATLEVSEVTLWRWLKKPQVRNRVQQARREAFSRCIARLQHASTAAVSALLRALVDKETPHASRIRAADCILSHAESGFQLDDLGVRLEKLEKLSAEQEGGGEFDRNDSK